MTTSLALLFEIRDEYYKKSWKKMLGDMEARLQRPPVIHKLFAKLNEDIAQIKKEMK